MAYEITHTTVKNDKKEVTHYDIKADGAMLGTATKTDKGKFNFKAADGAGKDLTDIKTMRDLKTEVGKNIPKGFVEANKPAAKPKADKPKTDKPAKAAEQIEQEERDAIEAAAASDDEPEAPATAASTDEDIDLD